MLWTVYVPNVNVALNLIVFYPSDCVAVVFKNCNSIINKPRCCFQIFCFTVSVCDAAWEQILGFVDFICVVFISLLTGAIFYYPLTVMRRCILFFVMR